MKITATITQFILVICIIPFNKFQYFLKVKFLIFNQPEQKDKQVLYVFLKQKLQNVVLQIKINKKCHVIISLQHLVFCLYYFSNIFLSKRLSKLKDNQPNSYYTVYKSYKTIHPLIYLQRCSPEQKDLNKANKKLIFMFLTDK